MPEDPASRFLDVTEAAQRLYEALSTLKDETEHYSQATVRLDAAMQQSMALCDANAKLIEEQRNRWAELRKTLDDTLLPALTRLSENADAQTVHLSSLSAAIAAQQSQLVHLQGNLHTAVKEVEQRDIKTLELIRKVARIAKRSLYAAAAAALFALLAIAVTLVI